MDFQNLIFPGKLPVKENLNIINISIYRHLCKPVFICQINRVPLPDRTAKSIFIIAIPTPTHGTRVPVLAFLYRRYTSNVPDSFVFIPKLSFFRFHCSGFFCFTNIFRTFQSKLFRCMLFLIISAGAEQYRQKQRRRAYQYPSHIPSPS